MNIQRSAAERRRFRQVRDYFINHLMFVVPRTKWRDLYLYTTKTNKTKYLDHFNNLPAGEYYLVGKGGRRFTDNWFSIDENNIYLKTRPFITLNVYRHFLPTRNI